MEPRRRRPRPCRRARPRPEARAGSCRCPRPGDRDQPPPLRTGRGARRLRARARSAGSRRPGGSSRRASGAEETRRHRAETGAPPRRGPSGGARRGRGGRTADKVTRRTRENDLPAVSGGGDARGAVDVEPDVALVRDERLARVDPDADANGAVAQARSRISSAAATASDARANAAKNASPCVSTSTPEWRARAVRTTMRWASSRSAYAVAVLVQQLRRARDVGEEERDGAAGEIGSHLGYEVPTSTSPLRVGTVTDGAVKRTPLSSS